MEHQTNSNVTSARRFGLPLAGWIALAGVAAALLAIFVFNVATDKVLIAGFVGLMLFSHLFMHGGHGSHGGHSNSDTPPSGADANAEQKAKHTGHSGGCH
ncbi:MAG: hypothetical protein KJ077_01210 [Anaerolineae bacterium]|nr:hypothetical protein [Anaerolineae bacterium]GIK37200.1 MAG: hypothetical protein BroJett011_10330 [Chloroflexota bacterium]